jgi:hypothetical protein
VSRRPSAPNDKVLAEALSEERAQALATLATAPTYNGAAVIEAFSIYGELDTNRLHDVLLQQCKQVHGGNLKTIEFTLAAQARSLDAIYSSLAWRAGVNLNKLPQYAETMLRLALRAQSQCRATLESLATIKSPPTVFAQQANIAHGHQQVNNGPAPARADAIKNRPNELLDGTYGERLDTRTTGPAGAGDPAMATVATIDGTAHRRRQSRR